MRPADLHRSLAGARFWWALCLALVLPLAQAASAAHALSHIRVEEGAGSVGKGGTKASHCDLCVVAAAVHGGGLPAPAWAWLVAEGRHAAPQGAAPVARFAAPAHHYRSRAPPLLLN